QRERQLSYLFISHNLENISHRIAVMYLGRIVEYADEVSLFTQPLHPYTEVLLTAIPIPDPKLKREKPLLEGDVPSPVRRPSGCHFHPGCRYAEARCRIESPILLEVRPGQPRRLPFALKRKGRLLAVGKV
ncbi:MAG: ABC transporter ATP-binding protein, partial [Acetobacteraceae bacterium]|nr:ABC transporter ATP-binding protein [Acetobacteraceae bacterium]